MKLKYTMQHEETGAIVEREFSINEAVQGIVLGWLTNDMRRYYVVSRKIISEFENKLIGNEEFSKWSQNQQLFYVNALESENLKLIDENKQLQCCGNCESWNPWSDTCRENHEKENCTCKSVCEFWKCSIDRE